MRVLVLGANGFVGRHVMAALAMSDWAKPIAGVRRKVASEHIVLDARSIDELRQALQNVDAVVNCVAGDAESIVANASALFAAAEGTGIHVVYLSSMAVYGSATGTVTEQAPLKADVGPYSASKAQAENLSLRYKGPVTIFRPGIIYGAGSPQWTERIAKLLKQRRIGDMGAAGDGCCNLVHVRDVVQAILTALQHRSEHEHRAYNLAMPDAPDWNRYFILFAKALGAVPVRRVTARRLKIETKMLAVPLKIGEKLLGGTLPPAITPSLARAWRQDLRLDSSRATQELSLSWMTLSEGISEAVAGRSAERI